MLETISSPTEEILILSSFRDHELELALDTNATHVLQKLLVVLEENKREQINFVLFNEEKIKQISDLEDNGLLLRLPFKVGSTLYQPIYSRINEYKVIGLCFDIHHNKWMYEVAYEVGFEWHKTVCDFNYIGKTVFLTQAEAEQKLKEMEGE